MSNPRETIHQPVSELSPDEMFAEIVYITERALANPKLARSQVSFYTCRLHELLQAYPEGPQKDRLLEKLRAKKRFNPYFNDTGNLDFTGYGEHFF